MIEKNIKVGDAKIGELVKFIEQIRKLADFNPDVDIEVRRDSIYFKIDHPDYTYKKELTLSYSCKVPKIHAYLL
jgi:hypothetical protein